MEKLNLLAAWMSIFIGLVAGLAQGMFFHDDGWLGGYAAWKRRLVRLGHISFFGLAFVNIAFVQSVYYFQYRGQDLVWASMLFILGLVTMPVICYLSAFRKNFRYLFVIPIFSLLIASGLLIFRSVAL